MSLHADEIDQQALPGDDQARPPEKDIQKPSDDAPETEVFTATEVRFMAEAHANAKHSKLRSEIAMQGKWLGVASAEKAQHTTRIAELESDIQELKQADSGDLTDIQAKRLELREEKQKLQLAQQSLQWSQAEHQDLIEQAEKQALANTAKQIAEEFAVKPEALLDQPTPDAMRSLAQKLAEAKAESKPGPAKPDQGVGASVGGDLSGMSPMALARKAYEEPKRK